MTQSDRHDFFAMLAEYDLAKYADKLHAAAEKADAKLDLSGWAVEVRPSPVHGLGAFLKLGAPGGAVVAPARHLGLRTRFGWYVNHGCPPNVEAQRGREPGDWDWVALRELQPGEELLADYRQVVRVMLADRAGVAPETLTPEAIRGAILRLWIRQDCPL